MIGILTSSTLHLVIDTSRQNIHTFIGAWVSMINQTLRQKPLDPTTTHTHAQHWWYCWAGLIKTITRLVKSTRPRLRQTAASTGHSNYMFVDVVSLSRLAPTTAEVCKAPLLFVFAREVRTRVRHEHAPT